MVLRDYSLHVTQGSIVALAGPNGCFEQDNAIEYHLRTLNASLTPACRTRPHGHPGLSTATICRPALVCRVNFSMPNFFIT